MKLIGFDILKQDEKLGWNSRAKHVDLKAPQSDLWGKQTNTLETHCNVTDQVGVLRPHLQCWKNDVTWHFNVRMAQSVNFLHK